MGTSYLRNRAGIAKILTVILGTVCVLMGAVAVDRVWKEEVYLGVVITCLVISILYLLGYMFIRDLDLQSPNRACDAFYHFLGCLLILTVGSLMLYSAVRLRWDTEYLCSGGVDRGIPCIYNTYDITRDIYGGGVLPPLPVPVPSTVPASVPSSSYGPSGYSHLSNILLDGRSFLGTGGGGGTSWLAWLKSSKAHLFEKCYEILPRLLNCNRYFELKIAAGVVTLMNGIVYALVGIFVLSN